MTGINDTENAQRTSAEKEQKIKDIPEKQTQQSNSEGKCGKSDIFTEVVCLFSSSHMVV